MHRYVWIIEYDGIGFYGWQKQPNCQTVQNVFEQALEKSTGDRLKTVGASRTDSGVSAREQYVHTDTLKQYPISQLIHGVQHHLGSHKIVIKNVIEVDQSFHARYSESIKTYRYKILNQPYPSALSRGWQIKQPLSFNREIEKLFTGYHDFSNFRSAQCKKNPHSKIDKISVKKHDNEIVIEFQAHSFLMHQIRRIVATMINIELGIIPSNADFFCPKFKKIYPSHTAPAYGLTLEKIRYKSLEMANLLGR